MKYILILLLFVALPAFAAEKEKKKAEPVAVQMMDVPELSFGQKVDIVVTAKQDPRVLDVKIEQDKQKIMIDVIVDKNQDRKQVEKMATVMILLTKSKSLDDQSQKDDVPGKGLYDYQVNYTRPDGVMILTALKPAKKAKIRFENPVPLALPATRVDAADQ